MWGRKDSDNLESIAKSLEKLLQREQERNSQQPMIPFSFGILDRVKEAINKEKIKVTDGLNPQIQDDIVIEEELKNAEKMNAKASQASREGNIPFWAEDLFEQEELENV